LDEVPDIEPVLESVLLVDEFCAKSAVADISDIPKAATRTFFMLRTLLVVISGSTRCSYGHSLISLGGMPPIDRS
jgi:hypothetical protein